MVRLLAPVNDRRSIRRDERASRSSVRVRSGREAEPPPLSYYPAPVPRRFPALLAPALLLAACSPEPPPKGPLGYMPSVVTTAQPEWIPFSIRAGRALAADPREKHLTELRQLTFAQGENAEGYFSPDGRRLIFQSTRDGYGCDQQFVMDLGSGETHRVSNGQGRTTCGFFYFPAGDRILYSSTFASGAACPPKADRSLGYTWALDEFDIYQAKADGSDLRLLIGGPGYDAETTMAFDGSRIVFTSTRDGDLDLYTAKPDGSDIRRITNTPGYDGGATFSPDSSRLVWRASRPTGAELDEYKALLAKHLVKPTALEIYVGGAEGQDPRPITRNGKANFAPAFLHDSRRVIFASNIDASPSPGMAPNFDLYLVDPDAPPTTAGMPPVERVTFYDGFDSFPMFSPDGEHLVFASNREGSKPGETNLFVARWAD
jgi:TolB protein